VPYLAAEFATVENGGRVRSLKYRKTWKLQDKACCGSDGTPVRSADLKFTTLNYLMQNPKCGGGFAGGAGVQNFEWLCEEARYRG